MDRQVQVADSAAQQFRGFDGAIRLEIIDQVAALAEAPAEFLYRPLGTPGGLYLHSFQSVTVQGLKITLTFSGFDEDPRRLVLVSIDQSVTEPEEP